MKHARANLWSRGYQPQDGNYMMCQLCGLRFRASEMRRQPHGLHQGLWVCRQDVEKYNPQFEDIKGVPERITPRKVNPEPAITTIGTNSGERFNEYDFNFVLSGYDGSQKITADDL